MFIDQFTPKYKLIKNIIYHILGGYDVHDGLRRVVKVLDQILVHVRVIGHPKAWLHGAEIMPGLDLRRYQSHCHATVNAVEGNLLNTRWDIMQAVVEERAPGIDGRCSCICCQLEVLELHR